MGLADKSDQELTEMLVSLDGTGPIPSTTLNRPRAKSGKLLEAVGGFEEGVERALFSSANTVMFGLPQMATQGLEKAGALPQGTTKDLTTGPGAIFGQLTGMAGPLAVGKGAAQIGQKATMPLIQKLPGATRKALNNPRGWLQGVGRGATEGAVAGALAPPIGQDPADLGARKSQAEFGALAGGGIGGTVQGAKAIFGRRGILQARGRAQRLSEVEQSRMGWDYEKRRQMVTGMTERASHSLEEATKAGERLAATGRSFFEDEVKQQGQKAAGAVQQRFGQVAGEASETYQMLVDEGLAAIKGKTVSERAIAEAVRKRLGDRALASTKLNPESSAQVPLERLISGARALSKSIPKSARKGTRVYTQDEKLMDDLISVYTDVAQEAGETQAFGAAKAYWSQWAPVRDQIVRHFSPFEGKAQLALESGGQFLTKSVERGSNQALITDIERRYGVPLTKDIRDTIERMKASDRDMVQQRLTATAMQGKLREASTEAKAQLSRHEHFAKQTLGQEQFKRQARASARTGAAVIIPRVAESFLFYQLLRQVINPLLRGRQSQSYQQ